MDDQFTSSFVLQHIRLVVTNFTLNLVEVEPTYCRLHLCVCVCVALPQLFRCFIRPKSYEKPRGGQTHIYLKIELFSLEHPYVTHFINVSIFKRVNSPRKQISRL